MRPLPVLIAIAMLAASCGPAAETPETAKAAQEAAAKADPAAAEKQKQADQKAAFDAALAANDEAKLDELAEAGNGFALHRRGQARLKSNEYIEQQGGFMDMEEAAQIGNAEAQLWVGTRMAYGLEGYPLKPNSGLMMLEKAARQDNIEAILAVGLMYEQDTFMKDMDKAKVWYERGVALGSDKAKDALAKLGTQEDL
jgi:hypothetical protein